MAKSVLDIIIKLSKQGGADKETVKGLVQVKSAILNAAAVAGTLVAAGFAIKKAFDATAGVLVAYADRVRRLSDATGISAEDSSRLIQVLDDVKISYDQLEKVVAKNGKTFDFSIEGIAAMSDEYLRLTDANEQAAFMQERFGKQWVSFVPIMKQGGQAIREGAAAIDDSLVLTQKAVNDAREYEIAVDALSDAWLGVKMTIGQDVLPVFTQLLNNHRDHARALEIMEEKGMSTYHAMSQVGYPAALQLATAEREAADAAMMQKEALDENTVSAEENAEALKLISEENKGLLDLVGKMQSAQESYREQYKTIAEDMNLTDDERKIKFAELAAEHDLASKKIVLGLLEQRLAQEGLTTEELNFLLEKGVAWGIYSDEVITEARNAMAEVDAMAESIRAIPTHKTFTLTVQQLGGYNIGTPQYQHIAHPGRAGGGPVTPGRMYTVGENGPEQFVSERRGTIVPNGASWGGGGGVNVSLTIASPVTIMDEQNAKRVLLPYIVDGIRQAQAKGQIR